MSASIILILPQATATLPLEGKEGDVMMLTADEKEEFFRVFQEKFVTGIWGKKMPNFRRTCQYLPTLFIYKYNIFIKKSK